MAVIFFKSGLVKVNDFDNTIALFADEYMVPFLPPTLAAMSGTFFELCCPVLLALGLCTRLAALPLLLMTVVIQFTYLDHVQHFYWMMIFAGLILHGGGALSVDHIIFSGGRQKNR
jgi:uncharacterized membrane protein YphA (DoxX/SURF4 family)